MKVKVVLATLLSCSVGFLVGCYIGIEYYPRAVQRYTAEARAEMLKIATERYKGSMHWYDEAADLYRKEHMAVRQQYEQLAQEVEDLRKQAGLAAK